MRSKTSLFEDLYIESIEKATDVDKLSQVKFHSPFRFFINISLNCIKKKTNAIIASFILVEKFTLEIKKSQCVAMLHVILSAYRHVDGFEDLKIYAGTDLTFLEQDSLS